MKMVTFLCIFTMLLSCKTTDNKVVFNELNAVVDSVRLQYVPDKRENVYEIAVTSHEGRMVLQGVTSVAQAKTVLFNRARQIAPEVIDSIRLLPDESLSGGNIGVINVSVADLRTEGSYTAEMATQLLLGSPVQLLQSKSGWYRVKAPDGYVAWIHGSSFVRENQEIYNGWESAPKIIFTADYGFAYESQDENGKRVADLVFGCLLKLESNSGRFYRVSYPDGRQAFVLQSQSQPYEKWKSSIQLTEESIVRTALELKGIPYTWGGTSVKAMDCSGFTKTVYLKHGMVLRRDASQQVKEGVPVDISNGYDNLRPGDLLFFGRKAEGNRPERVRHVAIYLGNKEFIHSSGFVHVSSFDPKQLHYDETNTKEFIYARRMIAKQ